MEIEEDSKELFTTVLKRPLMRNREMQGILSEMDLQHLFMIKSHQLC